MKIFISGGSGFVGKKLAEFFVERKHQVTAVGKSSKVKAPSSLNFSYISADATQSGSWQKPLRQADVVINLAGGNIFHFWTKKSKKNIYNSRILTTRNIVEALSVNKPVVLLSVSAAGYYGDQGDRLLSENSPKGKDFLAKVCADWEKEALKAGRKNVRVAVARLGVVLDKDGGALKKMLPNYRLFIGGPLGDGKQWTPWIHIEDLISAFQFILNRTDISGIFNVCSPLPVRNSTFSRTLAGLLGKPDFMRAPASLVKLLLRDLGKTLLNSQRVVPDNLLREGFEFKYPDVKEALSEILTRLHQSSDTKSQ